MFKKINFIFIVLFLGFTSYSQTSELSFPKDSWELIYQKDGVDFYVKNENCDYPNMKEPVLFSFLKLVNTTTNDLKVHCNFGIVFNETCFECQEGEFPTETVVKANSTLEASCENKVKSLSRIIVNKNLKGGYEFRGVQLFNVKIIK